MMNTKYFENVHIDTVKMCLKQNFQLDALLDVLDKANDIMVAEHTNSGKLNMVETIRANSIKKPFEKVCKSFDHDGEDLYFIFRRRAIDEYDKMVRRGQAPNVDEYMHSISKPVLRAKSSFPISDVSRTIGAVDELIFKTVADDSVRLQFFSEVNHLLVKLEELLNSMLYRSEETLPKDYSTKVYVEGMKYIKHVRDYMRPMMAQSRLKVSNQSINENPEM